MSGGSAVRRRQDPVAAESSLAKVVTEAVAHPGQVRIAVRDRRLSVVYRSKGWSQGLVPGLTWEAAADWRSRFRRAEKDLAGSALRERRPVSRALALEAGGRILHYRLFALPLSDGASGPAVLSLGVPAPAAAEPRRGSEEMIETLAHDVRNHVSAILRNLELVLAEVFGTLSAPQSEVLRAASDCGELAVGLAEDLQDVSRLDGGRFDLKLETFDLVEVVEAAVRRSRGFGTDRGILIEHHSPRARVAVRADKRRIERVVVNLLSNAMRFSPSYGAIELRCERLRGGAAQVAVTDAGPGISPVYQRRVFRKYFRIPGDGNGAGSGVGLFFCKETIERHGGAIWIQSPPLDRDRGTTVFFTLPGEDREVAP
jgi:NtrC-family two-component system sensor histidine kinase KinB